MKYPIVLLSFLLISFSCSSPENRQTEVKIDKNTVLIDIRTKAEFNSEHLKGAIHIPHAEIEKKINSVTQNHEASIVLYCRNGLLSEVAKKVLKKKGYKNVVNGGSYKELKKQRAKQKNKFDKQKEEY